MKYLKYFESSEEPLFTQIGYRDYTNLLGSINNLELPSSYGSNIVPLSQYDDRTITKLFSDNNSKFYYDTRGQLSGNMTHRFHLYIPHINNVRGDVAITITKVIDDWFLVQYSIRDEKRAEYFKCDQVDGLIDLFSFKRIVN